MRLGIYTNRFPYPPVGGIPRYLHDLCLALVAEGNEVQFVMPNLLANGPDNASDVTSQATIEEALSRNLSKSTLRPEDLLSNDIVLKRSNWRLNSLWSGRIQSVRGLRPSLAAEIFNNLDIAIFAGSPYLLFSEPDIREVLHRMTVPAIFVLLFPLREIEFYLGRKVRDLVANRLSVCANASSCLVVPSQYVKSEVQRHCEVTVRVLHIPHCLFQEKPRTKELVTKSDGGTNGIAITRMGDLALHKNTDTLVDAWGLVRSKNSRADLRIIGSVGGPQALSDPFAKQEGVAFVGNVSEEVKARMLSQSRVFISTSSIEAFGISILEALVAGVPVVAMRAAAIPEMISDGGNGFLLNPVVSHRDIAGTQVGQWRPDANELAERILRILTDDTLHETMQRNALKSALRFDTSTILAKHLSVFEALLQNT